MEPLSPSSQPGDATWPSEARLLEDMRWLGQIAARVVGDPDLAEDACQDAWLKAHRSGQGGATRKELLRGARRFVRRAWRAERRRQARERDAARIEAQPSMQDLLEVREQQQRLWSELLRLEEPLRTALILKYQNDLSTAQIAARTGVAQDTVRWRLRRGTAKLRERLVEERDGAESSAMAAGLSAIVRQAPPLRAEPYAGAAGLTFSKALYSVWIMPKWTMAVAAALVALLAFYTIALNRSPGVEPAANREDGAALATTERMAMEPSSRTTALGEVDPVRALAGTVSSTDVGASSEPGLLPSENLPPALLRLQVTTAESAPLPGTMEVQVAPYFEPFGLLGYPATAQFEAFGGAVEVPLAVNGDLSDFMTGPAEFPTKGVVTVTAEGFGIQRSGVVDLGWRNGDVTEVAMTLEPARAIRVVAVLETSRKAVDDVKILVQGPGAGFGSRYEAVAGEPLTLALARDGQGQDVLYVTGSGVVVRRYTTDELLQLPVLADGLRELELSKGQTLRGSVEMESGLLLPEGSELRYQVMQVTTEGGFEPFPLLVRQEGACSIDEHGRFELSGLPAGSVMLHLREAGRFVFETRRLGPDWRFELAGVGESDVALQVPMDLWTATIRVSLGEGAPWSSNTLLAATLYETLGESDRPYARPLGARPLVTRLHLFRSGEDVDLILPADTLEEGRPYLIALGANPTSCVERLVTFEGPAPRLEWTLTAAERDEAPPSASRPELPSPEESARRRAAQATGAEKRLVAKTPTLDNAAD